MSSEKLVLIFGATGNMGGAAARELLGRGWSVRAATRNPASEKAQALARLGSELVTADMDDRTSLEKAFEGMNRVLSVQNWVISGVEGEVRQGKLVAEVAAAAQVRHLVYGSAGTGEPDTGVPHFDAKLEVESHLRRLGVPFTIIRPVPFMELLTDKQFFPALAAWGVKPRIVGWDTPVPWIAVRDIGIAIANAFENPQTWVGRDVSLAGDVKSLAQCRSVFLKIDGKRPFRLPLPLWLFSRLAGDEFVTMWEWLADYTAQHGLRELRQMIDASSELCPQTTDVERWLSAVRCNGTVVS